MHFNRRILPCPIAICDKRFNLSSFMCSAIFPMACISNVRFKHSKEVLSMRIQAIVYTSNTGYTRQYAQMLGEKLHIPAMELQSARAQLPTGSPILYMGWLMAGKVQGYRSAARRYRVLAVCAVGMRGTGSQIESVRKANDILPTLPVFTLQGGYDPNRLKGIYKLMMTLMTKALEKQLKASVPSDERTMRDLLRHGGSRVNEKNLSAVLNWYVREIQND